MSRFATAVGMSAFLGGVVLLALGFPTRNGLGLNLVFTSSIPPWAFAASYLGGPFAMLVGATVGMRYGNFERYHKDYDPETGTIDSDHPFAALHERVSKPPAADGDVPEKFVMNRLHLITVCALPTTIFLVILLRIDFFRGGIFQWIVIGTLGMTSIVSFVVVDLLFRQSDDVSYEP